MTESTQVTLLRRMTRPHGAEAAENPLTSSRAVRLALTKAANDTVGLILTVESVAEEVTDLDDMLGALADELMLVALERDGEFVGLIGVDMDLRAAILEMQTMGAVLAQPAEYRAPTRTDKMLCDPLVDAFLSAFPVAVLGTPLEGWIDGASLGEQVESTRAAGLVLEDRTYRIVRMCVDLGVAERDAELVMCLPLAQDTAPAEAVPIAQVDWDSAFGENIISAPAKLDALLHRFPLSLATAQALQVGSVLPLPGCTVNSVRLLSPDGKEVAQAKLGQLGGYRAVRIEAAPLPQLAELPGALPDVSMPLPDAIGLGLDEDVSGQADDLPLAFDDPPDLTDIDLMADSFPALGEASLETDAP